MFSKLTIGLAVTMSLMLSVDASAQAKKADPKKAKDSKAAEAKKVEDARVAAEAAKAAKLDEEKALEAQRLKEAEAAAAKAETKDTSGVLGYIKSHFSASYHGEYYFQRRVDIYDDRVAAGVAPDEKDKDIQDIKIMHNPTIIYRPVTNVKLLVTSEFKYTDANPNVPSAQDPKANASTQGTFINRHFRSLVLLTKENVLTEKENGIKMDLTIGRRVFDRNHGKAAGYGNSRINTSLSKKFGDNLSTSMLVQYLANDPAKGRIRATTWKHSIELIPSFTFQITDKLSYFFNDDFVWNKAWQNNTAREFDISHEMNIGVVSYQFNDKNSAYFQLKYLHFANNPFGAAPDKNDWFEYYVGYTYSITPKFSITPEIGSEIFRGADGRDFFAQKVKYPELALYVDIAI